MLLVVEVCKKGRSLQSAMYKAYDNPSNPSNFPNGTFILLDIDIDSRSWLSHASPNTNNEFAAGRNTVVGKQPIHQAKKREIMICNFFIGSFFSVPFFFRISKNFFVPFEWKAIPAASCLFCPITFFFFLLRVGISYTFASISNPVEFAFFFFFLFFSIHSFVSVRLFLCRLFCFNFAHCLSVAVTIWF